MCCTTRAGRLTSVSIFNSKYYTNFRFKKYLFEVKYVDPEFSLRINKLKFTDLYFIYLKQNTLKSKIGTRAADSGIC